MHLCSEYSACVEKMITVLSQCSAARSRVQTKTCHEVTAEVKFRNFAREPEFTLSAARSTRATNLWVGSSNKTYVEHDSPSVSERAGVKLIKQSRTNYLLDISRDVNPAAQFSVEAYCVSSPSPSLISPSISLYLASSSSYPLSFSLSPYGIIQMSSCRVSSSRILSKLSISVPSFIAYFTFIAPIQGIG